jgi:hypothetical protein
MFLIESLINVIKKFIFSCLYRFLNLFLYNRPFTINQFIRIISSYLILAGLMLILLALRKFRYSSLNVVQSVLINNDQDSSEPDNDENRLFRTLGRSLLPFECPQVTLWTYLNTDSICRDSNVKSPQFLQWFLVVCGRSVTYICLQPCDNNLSAISS